MTINTSGRGMDIEPLLQLNRADFTQAVEHLDFNKLSKNQIDKLTRRSYGHKLVAIREDAGITQADVIRISGLSRRRVQRYENGTYMVPSDILHLYQAIADSAAEWADLKATKDAVKFGLSITQSMKQKVLRLLHLDKK
ncbi:helix-turn-helix domain-containing protein [Bowmanella denitrificans]|uniref:helix-turn-helix domain-containing protein n=1 Tax=Bowmanella denitrificans TaxID=366582 RepID=UPI0011AFAAB7|nr:helix-turn-helix transcriptional regulator [Bowmanella denitrificans]